MQKTLQKWLLCGAAITASSTIQAQPKPQTFLAPGGAVVQAAAYIDRAYRDSSRFSLQIVQAPAGGRRWDFTIDGDSTKRRYTNVTGAVSRVPYGTKKHITLSVTLNEHAIHEERVTFKNLKLGPLQKLPGMMNITPRYLDLPQPLTSTTPSGIRITLPAQGVETLHSILRTMPGNPNALFIPIRTQPNTRAAVLPRSPLYKQFRKPVAIKLECEPPNWMVWHDADNTFQTLAVGLPDMKTVDEQLDEFTLIVRQRVELSSTPLKLSVPVTR
jgi:hypothetical protein